jgi:hypothetical protein
MPPFDDPTEWHQTRRWCPTETLVHVRVCDNITYSGPNPKSDSDGISSTGPSQLEHDWGCVPMYVLPQSEHAESLEESLLGVVVSVPSSDCTTPNRFLIRSSNPPNTPGNIDCLSYNSCVNVSDAQVGSDRCAERTLSLSFNRWPTGRRLPVLHTCVPSCTTLGDNIPHSRLVSLSSGRASKKIGTAAGVIGPGPTPSTDR